MVYNLIDTHSLQNDYIVLRYAQLWVHYEHNLLIHREKVVGEYLKGMFCKFFKVLL